MTCKNTLMVSAAFMLLCSLPVAWANNKVMDEVAGCESLDRAGNCLSTMEEPGDVQPATGNVLFQASSFTHLDAKQVVNEKFDSRFAELDDEFDRNADFEEPAACEDQRFFRESPDDESPKSNDAPLSFTEQKFRQQQWRQQEQQKQSDASAIADQLATDILETPSRGLVFDILLGVVCAYIFLLIRNEWRHSKQQSEPDCSVEYDMAEDSLAEAAAAASFAADVQADDVWGCTRLHILCARGSVDEVDRLLRTSGATRPLRVVLAREAWGETPLHMAARHGNEDVCALLLAYGADIDALNDSDETPLLVAAKAGKQAACELLLSRDAGVGGVTPDQLPALLNALLFKRMIVGPSCVSTRVAPAAEDEFGCSALHSAAATGNEAEVEELLTTRRGDVKAREAWDDTPLHFAARFGHASVCETLMAHGAEVNALNFGGQTPTVVAAQAKKDDACLVLLAHGGHAADLTDAELPPLLATLMAEQVVEEGVEEGIAWLKNFA